MLVCYRTLASRAGTCLLFASSTGAHTLARHRTTQIVNSPAEAEYTRICCIQCTQLHSYFACAYASTHAHRDSLDDACMHIAAPATATTRPPTPRHCRAVAGFPRGARDSRGDSAPSAGRMQVDRRRFDSAPHHAIDATLIARRTQANTPAASRAWTSNSSTRTWTATRTSSRASACPNSSSRRPSLDWQQY